MPPQQQRRQKTRRLSISLLDASTSEVESNPEKVFAKGYGLSTGLAGQPNIFTLDARNAGFGDFDVVIKGASRATIEYLEEEEALYKIKYYVALPGDYQIEIKYDQHHIPGSPFSAKVMEPDIERASTLNSNSTVSVDSFSTSNDVSEEEEINSNKLPVYADVTYPSGHVVRGKIIRKNGKLTVKFAREEIGTYIVTIRNKKTNEIMSGSPYKVNVNAQKHNTTLIATGRGLKRANLNETNCFSIFAAEGMNLNDLCIAVLGHSSMKMNVFQNDLQSIEILYDIKSYGRYVFHIHEKGEDINCSPFDVQTSSQGNNNKEKKQEALRTLTITVWHGKDTLGNITTALTAPSGMIMPHKLSRRGRRLLEIRFLPSMNGEYSLALNFGGRMDYEQIFKVNVKNFPAGQEAFRVSGEGMHLAKINTPAHIYIDSLFPLSKSFAVEFDGPDKVDIIQSRSKEGQFRVTYTGKRKGNYVVSLKYDGFHVGGSPYHINILDDTLALTGDTSVLPVAEIKHNTAGCKAYGDGLSKATAGMSNKFTVDAFNAGSGSLMAGFDGHEGITEIVCKHMGNCVYEVQYKIMQPGTYKMNVLWAGSHIEGSPFTVHALDENNNV